MDLQPLLWSQGKTLVSLHRGTLHFHYFHVYSAWMQRLRSFQGLLQLWACTLSLKEVEWDFFITHLNRPTCHSTLLFLKYMNISMNTVVYSAIATVQDEHFYWTKPTLPSTHLLLITAFSFSKGSKFGLSKTLNESQSALRTLLPWYRLLLS